MPAKTPADPPPDDWTAEELLAEQTIDASDDPGAAVPEPSTWLSMISGRSPNTAVCPFFRAVRADGALTEPIEVPDAANRCAALTDAVPQSLRQQELVCLTTGHVNCPRYQRGAVAMTPVPPAKPRALASLTPAIAVSLATLALAFLISVGFTMANGGLTLPSIAVATGTPAASASAVAAAPSAGGSAASVAPSAAVPSASPAAVTASPAATASPTLEPTATPTATPKPTPKPTKKPTSDRYALLTACPGKSDCWIYVIRSGDNLASIANYFGVSLQRVKNMNPWTKTTGLKSGQQLRIPTPTR